MKTPLTTDQALQRAFPGEALARTRATLSQQGIVEHYGADEIIAFEGDGSPGLGLVVGGAAAAYALCSESGREVLVSTTHAGELVQDYSWFDVGPLPLTLRASRSGAEIFMVKAPVVLHCLREQPAFRLALLSWKTTTGRTLLDRLRELSFYEVRSRVARRLLDAELCGERLEVRRLATATATVPAVAARTLRRFQRQGVIALERGAPRIVDRGALHEAANVVGRMRRSAEMLFLQEGAS